MSSLIDVILVFVVLTNLTLVTSNRIATCIWLVAVQGMALGALPLAMNLGDLSIRVVSIGLLTFVVKGYILPRLLTWSLREADVHHEIDPVIGHGASVLLGVALLALSFWLCSRIELPGEVASNLVLPLAFSTILIGLFLIVIRKKALTQVIGYLVLENGIYIFGVALAHDEPFLIEMGVLLDVFVGVFVMGIAIFHISRAFDHIDTDQLSALKD